jgi:nitroimidazol reductase NimA-like FMN-containing flavoprotein (pyridoxamine 5'-phosphate oxidase superfamily)
MKEIAFIDGKTKIGIKNNNLSAYLERIEAAGYVVKSNKCKGKEGWRDVLMIGKARDFEDFFSGKAAIKEILKQSPQIYRLFFNHREIILYMLHDQEIV